MATAKLAFLTLVSAPMVSSLFRSKVKSFFMSLPKPYASFLPGPLPHPDLLAIAAATA